MINDRQFLHDVANVVKTTSYISSAFSSIPSVKWSSDDGQGIWQMKRESMLYFVKQNFFYRLVNRYTSTLWTFYERGSVKTNTISRILTKSFKHLLCCVPLSILLARVALRVHALWRFNAAFGCQSGAPALRFALFLSHLLPFFLSFPRGRPIRRKTVSLTLLASRHKKKRTAVTFNLFIMSLRKSFALLRIFLANGDVKFAFYDRLSLLFSRYLILAQLVPNVSILNFGSTLYRLAVLRSTTCATTYYLQVQLEVQKITTYKYYSTTCVIRYTTWFYLKKECRFA